MNKFTGIAVLAILLVVAGCTGKTDINSAKFGGVYDGVLNVSADPTFEPVMKQQQFIFEATYDSVKLNVAYKSESEMLKDMGSKRADVLIFPRALTEKERLSLKNNDTIFPREIVVAYDAVALIGNKSFDDSELDTVVLRTYFNPANAGKGIPAMVFDNQSRSLVNYMLSYMGYTESVSPNVTAVASPNEVISYVEQNKNAIGFIPFAMVADEDDYTAQEILKRVKILSLRTKNREGEVVQASANQSDIADGLYPLTRSITAVMRYDYKDDPSWLFVNFLHLGKGSRIFLKAGIVPARIPAREINVNTDGFNGIN